MPTIRTTRDTVPKSDPIILIVILPCTGTRYICWKRKQNQMIAGYGT